MTNKVLTEHGILSEIAHQAHTNELFHRRTQPNEDIILERNQRLRNEPEAFAKNDYFHQLASIPIIMWEKAVRDGYELNSKNNEHATKELMRYLRSPEGRTCMVRNEKV